MEPATPDTERLIVFDTTLRDGEQAPGFSMRLEEKLSLARALSELGVDVIEAGFPAASPGDFDAVRAVARVLEGAVPCALARCTRGDVERARDALQDAQSRRIHVFLATSEVHRERKLGLTRQQVVQRTREGVTLAREFSQDVEFSPEDATRTEPDFLVEVVETAIEAGATTINVPDTVGYSTPSEYAEVFRRLERGARGIDGVVLSAHCHDDLGLAVANSLAAVEAGARQVECTLNGIGERAGNAALEEVVMALRTRGDRFRLATGIDTRRLVLSSRLLSSITGVEVQPNKAVVGRNAFAHEAGIHQHGMLKSAETYEIMRPEDVGFGGSRLVLGKHSGRHALRRHARTLGVELEGEGLERAFEAFKELADRKREVLEDDLEALILAGGAPEPGPWTVDFLHTQGGKGTVPSATVRVRHRGGGLFHEAAVGDGPIDATFKALVRATGVTGSLRDYRVRSVTVGEDAQGSVIVSFDHEGRVLRGRGVSTDIVEASALAFLDAINQIEQGEGT